MKILLTLLITAVSLFAGNDKNRDIHNLKDPERFFQSVDDRAVGLLDKGELSNLLTNYGIISDFHLGTPALHWPMEGTDVQHYGFGVNLILVADGEILASVYDQSSAVLDFGWEALDGSLGGIFNDERNEFNTAGDGVTPFQAFSDRRETWAVIDGVPTWMGWYRENLENPGTFVEGEFVSDRDAFSVLQDNRGMELVIKQTGYTYGRPYAENFLFVRFRLYNMGNTDYDSCYIGFQADLKPDFYSDDLIQYWTMEPWDENPSFVWKWDYNGIAQRGDSSYFEENWIGPVGYIGMGMVDTPNDMGVTSFHYYNDDESPVEDEYFAAMLKNDTNAPLEDLDRYFHGPDSAIDDPANWQEVDLDTFPGSEITFTIGSGPFYLPVGDSADFAIVFAIGEDSVNLRDDVETAYYMAKERAYQGSGPPSVPNITATEGDGFIRLFWDNIVEFSIDALSGEMDFEGYKLYKSTDGGLTWGEPVTNYYGDIIGYVPIAQFDVADSITGLDPAYGPDFPNANNWLGDDTGLQHTYLDNDVTNGMEVWYCVTAYDKGVFDPTDPSLTEPSYENTLGISPYDQNIAAVTPGTQAGDITPGIGSELIEINGLVADGQLELTVVDESALKDAVYNITFNDEGDTNWLGPDSFEITEELTLNLENLTESTFRFLNVFTGDSFDYKFFPLSGDDQPVVDGFRITAKDIEGTGVRNIGWTTINGDSSTFDWWTENRHPGNSQAFEEVVLGLDDWRITVTDTPVEAGFLPVGFGTLPDTTIMVPLMVERADYDSGGVWVDATEHLWVSDLVLYFGPIPSLGPLGWDLIPGGAGYNPDPNTGTIWPDMLVLRDDENDTTGSEIWLKTQNGPEDAIPPSVGDVFTIETFKPFTSSLTYEFSTQAGTQSFANADLSKIKVVPNPIIVESGLETDPYESKVMFTHLPSECDIIIFTVSGNKVVKLHHESNTSEGFSYWDLRNKEGQNVAYGLYVYVVKTPDGRSTTGKLMVIR